MTLFNWASVASALAVPTLVAVLWLRLLYPAPMPGRWPILLGYGYLLGMLTVTLLLRLQAWLGWGLGYWPPTIALVAAALTALYARRRGWIAACHGDTLPSLREAGSALRPIAVVILLLLIAVRLTGLALEIWWLPLYPWDAWTTWAVRAQIWTHHQDLVPFVSPELWLARPAGDAHTIRAWSYPSTVSLLAAWPTLAFGSWNDTVANLPWLGCALALLLAFYGQARLWGTTALTALLFTWLLLSLPMLDTHIALAGYADLWLAAALGLSFFALMHWARSGDWRQALLAFLLALGCLLIKREGAVWILLFLPAILVARLRRGWLMSALAVLCVAVVVVWVNGGIHVTLPMLGEVVLSPEQLQLPYVGTFTLQYSGSWEPFIKHLLIRNNWHLLPFLLPITLLATVVLVARDAGGPAQRTGLIWILSALLVVYVLFFWTEASAWADKGTSINRILLHFAPALLFWMLTVWLALLPNRPVGNQSS